VRSVAGARHHQRIGVSKLLREMSRKQFDLSLNQLSTSSASKALKE